MQNLKQSATEGWIKNKMLVATNTVSISNIMALTASFNPNSEQTTVTHGFTQIEDVIYDDSQNEVSATRMVPMKTVTIPIKGKSNAMLLQGLFSGFRMDIPYDIKETKLKRTSADEDQYSISISVIGELRTKGGGYSIAVDEDHYLKYCVFRAFATLLAKSAIYKLDPAIQPDDQIQPLKPLISDSFNGMALADIANLVQDYEIPFSKNMDDLMKQALTVNDLINIRSTYRLYQADMVKNIYRWASEGVISNRTVTTSAQRPTHTNTQNERQEDDVQLSMRRRR